MSKGWTESVHSLLEDPSPAVLTTYKKDGSVFVSPVWFRWTGEAFELVVAEGDIKLRHLTRDPRCVLVVFEAVPPFRGVEVRDTLELIRRDITPERAALAGRYLGEDGGRAFAVGRRAKAGVMLRLAPDNPRVWDLSAILPADIANPS